MKARPWMNTLEELEKRKCAILLLVLVSTTLDGGQSKQVLPGTTQEQFCYEVESKQHQEGTTQEDNFCYEVEQKQDKEGATQK